MRNSFTSIFKNFPASFKRLLSFSRKNPLFSKKERFWKFLVPLLCLGGILLFIVTKLSSPEVSNDDLKEGLSYIQTLEQRDTSAIEKEIKEQEKAERKEMLEDGDLDLWQQFQDSVLIGDSRALPFYAYGFLEERRVLARNNGTLSDIPNYLDQLEVLNPSSVVLIFGLNDVGFWNTPEEYLADIEKYRKQIKERLPDSVIYINSIIPTIPPSTEGKQIPEWNKTIQKYCEENEIPYIDISRTLEEHQELYEPDGAHMVMDFYPLWGLDIITAINDTEA